MKRWNSAALLRLCILILPLMVSGCEGEDASAPLIPNPSEVYAELRLNHEAVILAMNSQYDTVQLRAIPLSLSGDTLPYTDTIYFTRNQVLDRSVTVDSVTGMVTASSTTSLTKVVARLTIGTVTRYDTVDIMVRNDPVITPITRLEFSPPPDDSAWRWATERSLVPFNSWARFYDAGDNPIFASQALARIRVQKPEVAYTDGIPQYYDGNAQGLLGETYIYASVYAYGQTLVDSMLFRRTDPPIRFIIVDEIFPIGQPRTIAFYPATIRAKAGSTIVFFNRFGYSPEPPGLFGCLYAYCGNRTLRTDGFNAWVDSVDINFDQPDAVAAGDAFGSMSFYPAYQGSLMPDGNSGNIPSFGAVAMDFGGLYFPTDEGYRARKFTVPGTYHYSTTAFPGVGGTIIITP